ncbi:hypothetical protein BCU70_03975 [Vibrio sp. 10N.286.49.C2]|uniref:FadR/GntR family transcriptional regulator n=1 Tax=unclassified Vibrio TaxID=2614977 RepID=UPI000C81A8A9|nr:MULTISPECIES: GntR family transcriptional regulator [unclassified Vibrio]PMH36752.1 hypothetical protein BCU70_03975 [Vibrio sp. 10N.286.49.C2]PMH54740.1 hypothetical protein BCU66_10590 [Vibrio sp. 10N.286.49.B1]PMH79397.1 hypothetical protein BCU58_05405 [Vibrio sp. 10N.286.48.B7]
MESNYIKISYSIARNIITGAYKENALPTEVDLSKQYSVSRSSIREALKLLSAKGLLASKQKSGTRITPRYQWNFVDPQLLEWSFDLPEMKCVIDRFVRVQELFAPEVCAEAANNATIEQRIELSKTIQAMETHKSNYDIWIKLCHKFHCLLFSSSNNEVFTPYSKIFNIIYSNDNASSINMSQSKMSLYLDVYNSIMVADHTKARKCGALLFSKI